MSIASLIAPGFLAELFDSIPDTDLDECHQALAEGRYIDASFACPAGTFLRELVTGSGSEASEAFDEEADDFDEEET